MSSEENENDQVYKVETVPPPEGEADAYNAPTRVGQMAATTIAEMLLGGAEESGAMEAPPVTPRSSFGPFGPPSPRPPSAPERPPISAPPESPLRGRITPPPPPPPESPASALPALHSRSTVSSIPPRSLEAELAMMKADSLVPRLHTPEEDEDEPEDRLAAESAPPASFQPMSLRPPAPPVFSRVQLILMLAIVVLSGATVYFLFR